MALQLFLPLVEGQNRDDDHGQMAFSSSWKSTAISQSYHSTYPLSHPGGVVVIVSYPEALGSGIDLVQEPFRHRRRLPLFLNSLVCGRIASDSLGEHRSKPRVFVVARRSSLVIEISLLGLGSSLRQGNENAATRSENSRVRLVLCSSHQDFRAKSEFLVRAESNHRLPFDAPTPENQHDIMRRVKKSQEK